MNFLRNFWNNVVILDQHNVISLAWLQKWLLLLIIAYGSLHYVWNWLVTEEDALHHFPPGLVPPELRQKLPAHGFTSEIDARAFALREIEFAVIACTNEHVTPEKTAFDAVAMMKSAALLSNAVIHFHIFTEDKVYAIFMKVLDEWPPHIRHRVSFRFRPVSYPESLLGWKNLYKPCSSFKLFLPHVVKELDYIMYVDNDALFLNPVEDLWKNMLNYNSSHIIALSSAQDNEYTDDDNGLWYAKHSHLPFFGKSGLNSGIILYDIFRLRHSTFRIPVARKMDCERCKSFQEMYDIQNMTWHPRMLRTLYELFKDDITMPDQDIFNIIAHFNPDKVFVLPCSWNFRWHYCESKRKQAKLKFLKSIQKSTPSFSKVDICNASHLVHGSAGTMANGKYPEFERLKLAWINASYSTPRTDILENLNSFEQDLLENHVLKSSERNRCMRINTELFVQTLEMCDHE